MSDITIVMTTWIPEGEQGQARLAVEEICLESWREHLINNGAIHLHVADDGSAPEYMRVIYRMAPRIWDLGEVTFSQQLRHGVGASLNEGLKTAFRRSPMVFHAVDDWELLGDLDLTPWISFAEDPNYDVGAIRFFSHPDLTGTIRHVPPHGWAIALDKHHYVFATRPSLWHKRLFDALGYFKEDCSALECEADFNEKACRYPQQEGEMIWLALTELWRPRESGSLSEVVPS